MLRLSVPMPPSPVQLPNLWFTSTALIHQMQVHGKIVCNPDCGKCSNFLSFWDSLLKLNFESVLCNPNFFEAPNTLY